VDVRDRGPESLQAMADGSETIWGLKPLDDFTGYAPATDDTPEKPGPPALSIDTDRMRRFVRERRAEGVSDGTIFSSLRLLRRMFHLATEKANASGRSALDAVPDFELPTKPSPGSISYVRLRCLHYLKSYRLAFTPSGDHLGSD
jgi:hypothetical protein